MNLNYEVFDKIAAGLNRPAALPEKDKFVSELVAHLAEADFGKLKLVFGGGTSLAKGHKIMERFSEDIDFRFVGGSGLSRTQKSNVKGKVADFINSLDDFNVEEIKARDENNLMIFFVGYEPKYPTPPSQKKPIKVEIIFADLLYPPVKRDLISFYNQEEKLLPETSVECISLEETAIDKISAFLCRTAAKEADDSVIRHLHDLARINPHISIDRKFRNALNGIYANDKVRFHIEKTLAQTAGDVINMLSIDKKYAERYDMYVSNMSYAPDADNTTFAEAVASFKKLMKEVLAD
jgi:predicted nucleotidyltransferase component of viral defense system